MCVCVCVCVCVCAVTHGSPSGSSHTSTPPSPASHLHTFTAAAAMPGSQAFSPPTLISPSQVQTLISQFHSPFSAVTTTTQRHAHSTTFDSRVPLTVQSVTIASDNNPARLLPAELAHRRACHEEQRPVTQLNGGIVLSSGQLQTLIRQIQSQQKQTDGLKIITLPYAGSR